MKINISLIIFLASIFFRNFMQVYLTRRKIKGRVSAKLGTISFYFCYLFALYLALMKPLHQEGYDFYFISGLLILWLGISLRIAALKHLGIYYSSFIEMRESQELVTEGLYSIIRHPLHFSILLEIVGMGIISTNLLSFIPIIGVLITIHLRNKNEENILRKHFGKEYEVYTRKVPSMNIIWGLIKKLKNKKNC